MIKKYFHKFSSFEHIPDEKNIPGHTVLYNSDTGHSLSILYLGIKDSEKSVSVYPIKRKISSPGDLIGSKYVEENFEMDSKEFERIYRLAFFNYKVKPKLERQRNDIKSKKSGLAEIILNLT